MKKQKKSELIRDGLGILKGILKAAGDTKKDESKKRAWQKKDCGTPC